MERLRYDAALAQRQFNRVDPDNRLVAAELESRWEEALAALKRAEEAHTQQQQRAASQPALSAELREAFTAIAQKLPQIWQQPILSQQNKKALLRCLIEKVVVHRSSRDCLQTRIVWRGGDTTTLQIPISVGSFSELSPAEEMEKIILDMSAGGISDEDIAAHLTALGHRSPMRTTEVLPSTVQTVRLKHRIHRVQSQSHPRRIEGYLTVSQITQALDISKHWVYDRIHNGRIHITKDPDTGLYLFPDQPATLEMFRDLKEGRLHNLRFSQGYQDA